MGQILWVHSNSKNNSKNTHGVWRAFDCKSKRIQLFALFWILEHRVFQDPRKLDRYALDKNAAALIQINSKFDYLYMYMYVPNSKYVEKIKRKNAQWNVPCIIHSPYIVLHRSAHFCFRFFCNFPFRFLWIDI